MARELANTGGVRFDLVYLLPNAWRLYSGMLAVGVQPRELIEEEALAGARDAMSGFPKNVSLTFEAKGERLRSALRRMTTARGYGLLILGTRRPLVKSIRLEVPVVIPAHPAP